VEQADPRGIDVALISKRPFTAYSFEIPGHTRGVLACRFVLGGEPVYMLVNHWKSRIGGGEEIRMACAKRNLELVNELLPRHEGRKAPTIVMGDLNDDDTDESVRHLEDGGLMNTLKSLPAAERWTSPWWDSMNKKAHYNSFDHIFVSRELMDGQGVDVVPDSARVARPAFMVTTQRHAGVKYEWLDDSRSGHVGYADHLPVTIKLRVPD
jgi:endonuclease/exonuclease/phosphatase family metal-dependent hydrolase